MTDSFDYVVVGLGGLGSAATWELARRGHRVLGLERFQLGHARGASHDTSRILRHSYHTPAYVRLTQEAYVDWARLERESGTALVTTTGGLDLFPPDPAIASIDYTQSMDEVGIAYDALDAEQVTQHWPQLQVPSGTLGLFQADAAIVPAGRTTAVLHDRARSLGAELREHSPVLGLEDLGEAGVRVSTADDEVTCRGVVVTADAWVNDVVGHLGLQVPLEVTLEQVTYFAVEHFDQFAGLPLWIWMDDPSFYGFPTYGDRTIKAAQDCGGPAVNPSDEQSDRTSDPDPAMEALLTQHVEALLPGVGPPVRSVRCQYALTPDRDFVMAPVPGHENVVIGLGAAHGFKFVPTFGRVLADLVTTGETRTDVSAFRLDRPALTQPDYVPHWLV